MVFIGFLTEFLVRGRKVHPHFHFLQTSLKYWIADFLSLYFRPTPRFSVFCVPLERIRLPAGLKVSQPFLLELGHFPTVPRGQTKACAPHGMWERADPGYSESILTPCISLLRNLDSCHCSADTFPVFTGRKRAVKRHLHGPDFTREHFSASIYTLESKFDAQIYYMYLNVFKRRSHPTRGVTKA